MNLNTTYYQSLLEKWKCCILIPVTDHAPYLKELLNSLSDFSPNLIIVRNSSEKETLKPLSEFKKDIKQVHLVHATNPKNVIIKGFEIASDLGYNYALTLSPNHHNTLENIPTFLESLEKEPGSLLIEEENESQAKLNGMHQLKRQLSSISFQIMTGKKLPLTQSNIRLYPIYKLADLRFSTFEFGFETEILVRSIWRGIELITTPTTPNKTIDSQQLNTQNNQLSLKQTFILNAFLITLGLFWYRPRNFFRRLREMNPRQIWNDYVLSSDESNFRLSLAVMLGLFISVSPLWGYQIVTILLLCHLLKLNKIIALIAGNISIPPLIPFVIWGSHKIGGFYVAPPPFREYKAETVSTLSFIQENFYQYFLGSVTLGVFLALLGGIISYILLVFFRK